MDQLDPGRGADGMLPEAETLTRQLSSGRNRVERITEHGKGLISDLTAWAELKMKLVQVEIEEKIDARVNKLVSTAIVAGIALLGVVMLLVALGVGAGGLFIAVGLSEPLSYFLGFLVVALVLFAAAAVIRSMHPHMVDVGRKEADVDQKKLTPVHAPGATPNGS
ncbi:MAG TPA: phage holin family protein [Rhodothermales bacterium]